MGWGMVCQFHVQPDLLRLIKVELMFLEAIASLEVTSSLTQSVSQSLTFFSNLTILFILCQIAFLEVKSFLTQSLTHTVSDVF